MSPFNLWPKETIVFPPQQNEDNSSADIFLFFLFHTSVYLPIQTEASLVTEKIKVAVAETQSESLLGSASRARSGERHRVWETGSLSSHKVSDNLFGQPCDWVPGVCPWKKGNATRLEDHIGY